jgi:hypothetical protein
MTMNISERGRTLYCQAKIHPALARQVAANRKPIFSMKLPLGSVFLTEKNTPYTTKIPSRR